MSMTRIHPRVSGLAALSALGVTTGPQDHPVPVLTEADRQYGRSRATAIADKIPNPYGGWWCNFAWRGLSPACDDRRAFQESLDSTAFVCGSGGGTDLAIESCLHFGLPTTEEQQAGGSPPITGGQDEYQKILERQRKAEESGAYCPDIVKSQWPTLESILGGELVCSLTGKKPDNIPVMLAIGGIGGFMLLLALIGRR